VRDAQTKAPLAGVTVKSQSRHGEPISGWGQNFVRAVTDEQGRYPPDGVAYLARRTPFSETIRWEAGDRVKEVNMALPRGVLVRGKVVESGTDAPVVGASIQYLPEEVNNPNTADHILTGWQGIQLSNERGEFEIAVLPGPGRLLVHGPKGKYVLQEIASRKLREGKPGGRRNYVHAVHEVDPEEDADPLGERLALMWHNHFATSNRKVQNLVWMREQNELFRQHGRGPFAELLRAVIKHPAMLVWLDADSNRKGHPNENLARELTELFTVGIGNYTEADIKEAARALTGWTVMRNEFQIQGARHDPGEKAVLSHRGKLTGDDLLDLLIEHPSTARRLAWRLCGTFMGEGVVDDDALDRLTKDLGEHGLDIGWAVETILRSELFFSEKNLRARV
jgi:hypothetical protein